VVCSHFWIWVSTHLEMYLVTNFCNSWVNRHYWQCSTLVSEVTIVDGKRDFVSYHLNTYAGWQLFLGSPGGGACKTQPVWPHTFSIIHKYETPSKYHDVLVIPSAGAMHNNRKYYILYLHFFSKKVCGLDGCTIQLLLCWPYCSITSYKPRLLLFIKQQHLRCVHLLLSCRKFK
jgi:hypothetical protein